jgi:hypothetical protein
MYKILELTRYFYRIVIPRKFRKEFLKLTQQFLDERYSIETAIGLAITKLKLK